MAQQWQHPVTYLLRFRASLSQIQDIYITSSGSPRQCTRHAFDEAVLGREKTQKPHGAVEA